ncbi:hypothetical protein AB5J72_48925 [Streptomyces sp. CG1]|uniref:hypothetical protein n=1 Tax=Streptomyces sp. CG1 TaxID=1287523 RepID=UPI0034E29C47
MGANGVGSEVGDGARAVLVDDALVVAIRVGAEVGVDVVSGARAINKLSRARAVATRYGKRAYILRSTVTVVSILVWLRLRLRLRL